MMETIFCYEKHGIFRRTRNIFIRARIIFGRGLESLKEKKKCVKNVG